MFIFALLLLTKIESTNLMNINEKWALGLQTTDLSFNGYFLSHKLGKTVTLGMELRGLFYGYRYDSTRNYYNWEGTLGITLSKYFCARKPISPFIALNPTFKVYYNYDEDISGYSHYFHPVYGINLDTGLGYFFNCWSRNFSLQIKTPLVAASRTSYTPDRNYDYINFYFPGQGSLSTYLCLYY